MDKFVLKLLVVHLVSLIGRDAECAVTLEKFRDKLSKVLDTESKELTLLSDLLERSENEIKKQAEVQDSDKSTEEYSHVSQGEEMHQPQKAFSDTLSNLRDHGVIAKLQENTKRMGSMELLLADLKNVLSEAVNAQAQQMRFETEIVELREEIQYMRKQHHQLKKDYADLEFRKNTALDSETQNEKAAISWLNDATKELKTQLSDMSKFCNASALLQLNQKLNEQNDRQQMDIISLQKQIEEIQVQQLRQDEQVSELHESLVDVRSWQTNMGQKFMNKDNLFADDRKTTSGSISSNKNSDSRRDPGLMPFRHGKLRNYLRKISRNTKALRQELESVSSRLKVIEERPSFQSDGNLHSDKETMSMLNEKVSSVENTMSQLTLTLQDVENNVNVINEIKESNSEFFSALENLETRHDEKLTEIQTNIAKLEASVNSIENSNEELKEQQAFNDGTIQNLKKENQLTKSQLQKNKFRLASLQTHLLKWSTQKCSVENAESIQNIRISTLETMLHQKSFNKEKS